MRTPAAPLPDTGWVPAEPGQAYTRVPVHRLRVGDWLPYTVEDTVRLYPVHRLQPAEHRGHRVIVMLIAGGWLTWWPGEPLAHIPADQITPAPPIAPSTPETP